MSTLKEVLEMTWEEPKNQQELYQPVEGYPVFDQYSDATVLIEDKKISDFSAQTSVTGESYSQYIEFLMPRYSDGVDLLTKKIQIIYEVEKGIGSANGPVNVMSSPKNIKFGWIVPEKAVSLAKKILIAVAVIGFEGEEKYVWKTLPAEYVIKEGLEIGEGIPEPDDNWYEQFVNEMDKKIAEAYEMVNNSTADIKAATKLAVDSAENANSVATDLINKRDSGYFTGPVGATGPQGPIGNAGPKGDKGDKGDIGGQGSKGDTGPQGPKGDKGAIGERGEQGRDGVATITNLNPGMFMLSVNNNGNLLLTHNDNEPAPPMKIVNGRLIYTID